MKLTLRAQNRATLARQMLLARERASVAKTIASLVGLQAQWPAPPYVGLWTRVGSFDARDLTRALVKREIVRATFLRGTIHASTAEDFAKFRPLLQPMLSRATQSILRDRAAKLDIPALVDAGRAFFGDEPRTFGELRDHLVRMFPKGEERAMGFVVRTHLPLVMVPTDARWGFPANADFAPADAWLAGSAEKAANKAKTASKGAPRKTPRTKGAISADADLGALVVRYLAAFGPAKPTDMQTWSGLPSLRGAFDAMRDELVTLEDEHGRELFDVPSAPRPNEDTPAPVRFLPEFDNVLLSHVDRSRIVPSEHKKKVYLPGLRVASTVLVDGFVAGTWKIASAKGAATLTVTPFHALSRAVKEDVTREGDALVKFVEPEASRTAVAIAR